MPAYISDVDHVPSHRKAAKNQPVLPPDDKLKAGGTPPGLPPTVPVSLSLFMAGLTREKPHTPNIWDAGALKMSM